MTSSLINVDRERSMLASLDSLSDVLRKETEYAAMTAALKKLETEDMPEAADARRRVEALHVLALKRSGEISDRLPKDKPRPGGRTIPGTSGMVGKSAALKEAGLSTQRASEREAIAEVAEEEPEAFEDALASDEPTAAVSRLVSDHKKSANRARRVAKIVEISAGNAELESARRYPVLLADPPWEYEHVKTESRAIENQYPTMALDEICALPVADVCTEDALLFLWATSPKLEESFRVLSAWGFTYRTCMVWVKDKIGMGYYARQRHELLLICTKGNPPTPVPAARPDSVVEAPRGAHSAKPEVFRDVIEKMYPEFPRLELFCRDPRPGWDSWGNQARRAS